MYFAHPTDRSYAHRMPHKKSERFVCHPHSAERQEEQQRLLRELQMLVADPCAGTSWLDGLILRELIGHTAVPDIPLHSSNHKTKAPSASVENVMTPQDVTATHLANVIQILVQQRQLSKEVCARIGFRNKIVDQILRETCAGSLAPTATAESGSPGSGSPTTSPQKRIRCSPACHVRLAKLLQSLDHATDAVVSGVLRWRMNLRQPLPFLFDGSNYLLRIEDEVTSLVPKCEVHLKEAAGGCFTREGCEFYFSSAYSGDPQLFAVPTNYQVKKRSVAGGSSVRAAGSLRSSSVILDSRLSDDDDAGCNSIAGREAPVSSTRLAARRFAVHSAVVNERATQEKILREALDATTSAIELFHRKAPLLPSPAVHVLSLAPVAVLLPVDVGREMAYVPPLLSREVEMDPFTEEGYGTVPPSHESMRRALERFYYGHNPPHPVTTMKLTTVEWITPAGFVALARASLFGLMPEAASASRQVLESNGTVPDLSTEKERHVCANDSSMVVVSSVYTQKLAGGRAGRVPKLLPPLPRHQQRERQQLSVTSNDSKKEGESPFVKVVIIDSNGCLTLNGLTYLLNRHADQMSALDSTDSPAAHIRRVRQVVLQCLDWTHQCLLHAQSILEEPFGTIVNPIINSNTSSPSRDATLSLTTSDIIGSSNAISGFFSQHSLEAVPVGKKASLRKGPRSLMSRRSIVDDASIDSLVALSYGEGWNSSSGSGVADEKNLPKLISLIRRTVRRLLLRKLQQWTKHVSQKMQRRNKAHELEAANRRVLLGERYSVWLFRVELLQARRSQTDELWRLNRSRHLRMRWDTLRKLYIVQKLKRSIARSMFEKAYLALFKNVWIRRSKKLFEEMKSTGGEDTGVQQLPALDALLTLSSAFCRKQFPMHLAAVAKVRRSSSAK